MESWNINTFVKPTFGPPSLSKLFGNLPEPQKRYRSGSEHTFEKPKRKRKRFKNKLRTSVYRKPESSHLSYVHQCLSKYLPQDRLEQYMMYLTLCYHGKRNLEKKAQSLDNLSILEKTVYDRVQRHLSNPIRKKRIEDFCNKYTKRLVNFFVVHYVTRYKPLSYYLDKRTEDYKIIGQLNKEDQPDILELISRGEKIVYINVYQEYKTCKQRQGRQNLHAPYARGKSVMDDTELSLCENNFYTWFDEIGGIEIFERFHKDIKQCNIHFCEEKRREDKNRNKNKKKKKKKNIHLPGNYTSCMLHYPVRTCGPMEFESVNIKRISRLPTKRLSLQQMVREYKKKSDTKKKKKKCPGVSELSTKKNVMIPSNLLRRY